MTVRAVTILVLLMATPAFAVDESEIKALSKLAKEDPKRAAGLAKLVTKARKTMALDCQQSLAEYVFSLVPLKDRRFCPAALLPRLERLDDPKSFAYFSAHHLAYPALFGATISGNYEEIEPALALAVKRSGAKYGAYAQAMADYAKGIKARATPLDAIKLFQQVLAACTKHGWSQLALRTGMELTLACLATEDMETAKRVMQDTFAAVREDADAPVLYDARTMVGNRLRDSHAALHAAWDEVLAKRIKGYSRGGGAGAGGCR